MLEAARRNIHYAEKYVSHAPGDEIHQVQCDEAANNSTIGGWEVR